MHFSKVKYQAWLSAIKLMETEEEFLILLKMARSNNSTCRICKKTKNDRVGLHRRPSQQGATPEP